MIKRCIYKEVFYNANRLIVQFFIRANILKQKVAYFLGSNWGLIISDRAGWVFDFEFKFVWDPNILSLALNCLELRDKCSLMIGLISSLASEYWIKYWVLCWTLAWSLIWVKQYCARRKRYSFCPQRLYFL